jgi:hypothetical protein
MKMLLKSLVVAFVIVCNPVAEASTGGRSRAYSDYYNYESSAMDSRIIDPGTVPTDTLPRKKGKGTPYPTSSPVKTVSSSAPTVSKKQTSSPVSAPTKNTKGTSPPTVSEGTNTSSAPTGTPESVVTKVNTPIITLQLTLGEPPSNRNLRFERKLSAFDNTLNNVVDSHLNILLAGKAITNIAAKLEGSALRNTNGKEMIIANYGFQGTFTGNDDSISTTALGDAIISAFNDQESKDLFLKNAQTSYNDQVVQRIVDVKAGYKTADPTNETIIVPGIVIESSSSSPVGWASAIAACVVALAAVGFVIHRKRRLDSQDPMEKRRKSKAPKSSWTGTRRTMSELAAGATQEEFSRCGMKVQEYGDGYQKKKSSSKKVKKSKKVPASPLRGSELETTLDPIEEADASSAVSGSLLSDEFPEIEGLENANMLPPLSLASNPSDEEEYDVEYTYPEQPSETRSVDTAENTVPNTTYYGGSLSPGTMTSLSSIDTPLYLSSAQRSETTSEEGHLDDFTKRMLDFSENGPGHDDEMLHLPTLSPPVLEPTHSYNGEDERERYYGDNYSLNDESVASDNVSFSDMPLLSRRN